MPQTMATAHRRPTLNLTRHLLFRNPLAKQARILPQSSPLQRGLTVVASLHRQRRQIVRCEGSAPVPLPTVKRYHVTTFGCQMNEHDSERMKGMLDP
jgi:hypothetical protein